jgi:hypothetical protein
MLRSKQSRADAEEVAKPLRTPHVPSRIEVVAWPLRLARFSRWMHKWVGTLLALIMVGQGRDGVSRTGHRVDVRKPA